MADAKNKVVVVTGGSTGIGRAVALAFAGPGVHLCFNHFDPDDSESLKTEEMIREKGGTAKGLKVDVSDKDAVHAFFRQVADDEGRLDVCVNNAGITKDGLLLRMKEPAWDAVMNVNLKGVFFCIQEAARIMMKQRSGRIVNIASVVGVMGNAGQANYSAAKAGVIGLTKTSARELASRGITVNAVAPGFIDTAMTKALPEKVRETFVEQTPLGCMGSPEDVAGAVAFLASDRAGFITGHTLHVNGGLYM